MSFLKNGAIYRLSGFFSHFHFQHGTFSTLSDYRGRGYATEACRVVLDDAFNRLQADNVITGTAAANLASCRLIERLGFKKTAENTGSFRNATDGKPIMFLGYNYAISRNEWVGKR